MIAIERNFPAKLTTASLTAPADVAFALRGSESGADFSAVFQAVGTLTTLTASLQISLDGGVTWTDFVVAGSFLTPASPVIRVTPMVAGALYRIHATALTGSQDFWVVLN